MKKIIHVATPEMLGVTLVSLGMPILIYDKEYKLFYSNIVSQKDATELEIVRELLDLEHEDYARDRLLTSLSHELRNPLAPIRNMIELLRLKTTDVGLIEYIDVLDQQFDRMAELITQLLDSTRFTHGKIELHLEPVDVVLLLNQVVRSIRPLIDKMGLTLTLSVLPDPTIIIADRLRIEQVVANLLHNAVKFTPAGGVIHIELSTNTDNISISVKDSGGGITGDEMKSIFKPYYQSERMRSENKGLGVGLDLVSKIISLHNGNISVRSEGLNKGSEFVIVLPLRSVQRNPEGQQLGPALPAYTKKILVVDDNVIAADTLVQLLVALGYEAKAIYNSVEVPQYFAQNKVDAAFLDIGMPEMDGYELVKILRDSGNIGVPIIALSGYGQDEDKRKAKDAGFTAHLTKPAGMKELQATLV